MNRSNGTIEIEEVQMANCVFVCVSVFINANYRPQMGSRDFGNTNAYCNQRLSKPFQFDGGTNSRKKCVIKCLKIRKCPEYCWCT